MIRGKSLIEAPSLNYYANNRIRYPHLQHKPIKQLAELGIKLVFHGIKPENLTPTQKTALVEIMDRHTSSHTLHYLNNDQLYVLVPQKLDNIEECRNYTLIQPPLHFVTVGISATSLIAYAHTKLNPPAPPAKQLAPEPAIRMRAMFIPKKSAKEHTPEKLPPLKLDQGLIADLRALMQEAEVFSLIPRDGNIWTWGRMEFGPKLSASRHYRGYAQVDVDQIPMAVNTLKRVAEARAAEGKPTTFKFLISKFPIARMNELKEMPKKWPPEEVLGIYADPDSSSPVIAIYSAKLEDALEILEALRTDEAWDVIENERRERGHVSRREGTSSYKGMRTLNYNIKPGNAEDLLEQAEAQGRDWRSLVSGTRTANLKEPE